MGNPNILATEKLGVVGVLSPVTVVNSEVFTTVVDMSKFHQAVATLMLGDMAAETIDFRCVTCASDGSSPVLLKAATQLAAHATNNDNKQIAIGVRAEDLQSASARYVKFGVITGGASGGPASILVQATDARYDPASSSNLASVVQVKN